VEFEFWEGEGVGWCYGVGWHGGKREGRGGVLKKSIDHGM